MPVNRSADRSPPEWLADDRCGFLAFGAQKQRCDHGSVRTRQRIDEVLDGLPESELEPLLEIILSRVHSRSHDSGSYPTVVPAFAGRSATAAEFQRWLEDLPAGGER